MEISVVLWLEAEDVTAALVVISTCGVLAMSVAFVVVVGVIEVLFVFTVALIVVNEGVMPLAAFVVGIVLFPFEETPSANTIVVITYLATVIATSLLNCVEFKCRYTIKLRRTKHIKKSISQDTVHYNVRLLYNQVYTHTQSLRFPILS